MKRGGDYAVALLCISAAVFFFVRGSSPAAGASAAVVTLDGAAARQVRLDTDSDQVLNLVRGTMRLQVRGGKIRAAACSCPGQDCVHTGWIHMPGQSIVCVPNKVIIEIPGIQQPPYDAITY